MDDNEYYAMMRRQYSHPVQMPAKPTNVASPAQKEKTIPTAGTANSFTAWHAHHGREDAEMLNETSNDDVE